MCVVEIVCGFVLFCVIYFFGPRRGLEKFVWISGECAGVGIGGLWCCFGGLCVWESAGLSTVLRLPRL